MSILTPDGLPEKDRCKRLILTDYRNMIRLEDVYNDPELTQSERVVFGVQLLYGENVPADLNSALNELIWFFHCGKPPTEAEAKRHAKAATLNRAYDFEEDAGSIFASFWQAYGIDLARIEYLHWWEFMALFLGLPEDTKMAQMMHYRLAETKNLPKEQKKHYELMKRLYALQPRNRPTAGTDLAAIEQYNKKRVDDIFARAEAELAKREAEHNSS